MELKQSRRLASRRATAVFIETTTSTSASGSVRRQRRLYAKVFALMTTSKYFARPRYESGGRKTLIIFAEGPLPFCGGVGVALPRLIVWSSQARAATTRGGPSRLLPASNVFCVRILSSTSYTLQQCLPQRASNFRTPSRKSWHMARRSRFGTSITWGSSSFVFGDVRLPRANQFSISRRSYEKPSAAMTGSS